MTSSAKKPNMGVDLSFTIIWQQGFDVSPARYYLVDVTLLGDCLKILAKT